MLPLFSPFRFEVNSFMNASERSLASRLIALTAISVLAGCGGGKSGGSFAPPMVPIPPVASGAPASVAASTTLSIAIPGTSAAQTSKRRARYVSSATNSLTFTIVGGATSVVPLLSTSPNCSTDASGTRLCNINVSAPTGTNVPFVLSTFASADGSGAALSTARASQTISSGKTNQIDITLDAVVSTVAVALGNNAFSIGKAGSTTVIVNALDAAGKLIGVGANNLVDAQDNPVTLSLSSSDPSVTLSATTVGATPITLSYSGAAPSGPSISVGVKASSGSSASLASSSSLISFLTAYASVVGADKPLAYYRLAEPTGTIANDASGLKNDGAYKSTVAYAHPGLLNGDSNAKSASFKAGYATSIVTWGVPAVTAECWVRPTANDLAGNPRIIGNAWADHAGNGFMLWIANGTVAFDTGWAGTRATLPMSAGNAYHVVGTFDVTVGTTVYLNGVALANNKFTSLQPNPQLGDSATTYIGALNAHDYSSGGGPGIVNNFEGDISDCAIYDHSLTPAQVAAHYNAGALASVVPVPIPTIAPTPPPPSPTTPPAPIVYNSGTACIAHKLYSNDVLPGGEGEFQTNGLDRTWWGRMRGNTVGGNQHSGFGVSWGRNQYDSYFGDVNDGISLPQDDPFYVGPDIGAPGSPQGVRISAVPMPAHLVGNPKVGGASYYAGALDTPINQQYGFFVARVRTPAPAPGLSPAFWMLSNDGMPQGPHGPLNGEWDIQEMFGADYGNGQNAGNLQWNSGSAQPQNWGGAFDWPATGIPEATTPSSDYHDWGVLLAPGGAVISANDYGAGGPGMVYGAPGTGVTNYLDGVPIFGHTGGADITSGQSWKELFAMFQVAPQGSWLGSPVAQNFPQYYWIQWIRAYRPTASPC